jgi:hypothetical protein
MILSEGEPHVKDFIDFDFYMRVSPKAKPCKPLSLLLSEWILRLLKIGIGNLIPNEK